MFPNIGSLKTLIWGYIMLDYEKYLARHGESGVQDIIEKIERREGRDHNRNIPLEDRWYVLIGNPSPCYSAAA
jgi:hypothetical protein